MMDYAKARVAYDNSPIGVVLFESVLDEDGKFIDLEICYINAKGAAYWGATPDQMTGIHFLETDENADERWLILHQEIQVNGKKKSLNYYSPALKKTVRIDCFMYASDVTGCFIQDAEFEASRLPTFTDTEDTRPMTEQEQIFSQVIKTFAIYESEAYNLDGENDFICFSDIETREIVEIVTPESGKTAGSLLEGDYRGKKCYSVLQNRSAPCPFCSNHLLNKERYHIWQHYNDSIEKEYLHKTKMVKLADRYVRMDISQDITDSTRKSVLLAETLEGMSLWSGCMSLLEEEASLENALQGVIANVGMFFGATRAAIVLQGLARYEATWSLRGISEIPPILEDPTRAAFDEWGTLLKDKSHTLISDTNDPKLPEDIRNYFKGEKIPSALFSPIFVGESLKGVASMDGFTKNKSQIYILDMIAQSIANSFNQHELQDRMSRLRFRDPLTNHLNFEGFKLAAEHILKMNGDKKYSLWYSDIRRFKYINDMFGYEIGDGLLQYWAQIIDDDISGNETFCRISADNVAILCSYNDQHDLERRFARMVARVIEHPGLKGRSFRPEIASGVYLLGPDDMRDIDINKMMNRANIAQKSIKQLSGNRVAFYDDSMRERQLRELEISQHLKDGLANGEFSIVLQPQYRYTTDEIIGAEALVRWNHPELGSVSPGEFIPLLEKAGLIGELDEFVWEEACKYVRFMIDSLHIVRPVPISVNISRVDIYLPDLEGTIFGLVERYGFEPMLLKLEITESAYIADSTLLIDIVEGLRKRGFSIEMDDFGSGYSSLNTLKDVPVDVLKLDMKFLAMDASSERGGSILSSVIRMAHGIGLPVIAEGVESRDQADYLKVLGCYMMQGYYFARPMSTDDFTQLLVELGSGGQTGSKRDSAPETGMIFPSLDGIDSHLFNNCIGGGCLVEYDGTSLAALLINDAFYEMLGISRRFVDARRERVFDLFAEEDHQTLKLGLEEAIKTGASRVFIRPLSENDEEKERLHCVFRWLSAFDGRHSLLGMFDQMTGSIETDGRDASISHRWHDAQYQVMAALHNTMLFEYDVSVDEMVFCMIDDDGKMEEVTYSGYLECRRFSNVHSDDRDRYRATLKAASAKPMAGTLEFRSQFFSSSFSWCRASYVSIENDTDEVKRIVGRVDNIEQEKQLQRQINRDSLTGFYNQHAAVAMIGAALEKKPQGVLLKIDINDFNVVNDTHGHMFGDTFLREVAESLEKIFRDDDILGRVGGDEFVVFVGQSLDTDVVERKAESIIAAINDIEIPRIGAAHVSVGVAHIDSEEHQDYESVFKKANLALLMAKQQGRSSYVVYA